ncbi:MAG TPA: hypothetical protein VF190_11240 [Rhodothermales bacterium]
MQLLARLIAVVFVVPAVFYFVYWVPFSFIRFAGSGWVALIVSLASAGTAGYLVWTRMSDVSSDAVRSTLMGALIVGGIGFTLGFFGPLLLAPDANQGPLLGIFITGPLGAVAGAIGGFVRWIVVERERTYR